MHSQSPLKPNSYAVLINDNNDNKLIQLQNSTGVSVLMTSQMFPSPPFFQVIDFPEIQSQTFAHNPSSGYDFTGG